MGDRGQIAIAQGGQQSPVYLYTHWGGSELPATLAEALAKRWRWDDDCYLARVILDTMTEDEHGTETGYGICTAPHGDIEYPLLVVDCERQAVGVVLLRPYPDWNDRAASEAWATEGRVAEPLAPAVWIPFEDFIARVQASASDDPWECVGLRYVDGTGFAFVEEKT